MTRASKRYKGPCARALKYPYLITGALVDPDPAGDELEFRKKVVPGSKCFHGAYLEHHPTMNMVAKFTLRNSSLAPYELEQGDERPDTSAVRFSVTHRFEPGADNELVLSGGMRQLTLSAVSSGEYQMVADVVVYDFFTEEVRLPGRSIACTFRLLR